nr:MAG TPA: hypothetical protein [Caudoviricetes sp.]
MRKKIVIVATANGARKVLEKWITEDMSCELYVSRNARRECCVEVIYDSKGSTDLRGLLQAAKGEIIELQ